MDRRLAIGVVIAALAVATFLCAPKLVAAHAEEKARRAEQAEIAAAVTSDLPRDFLTLVSDGVCQRRRQANAPVILALIRRMNGAYETTIVAHDWMERSGWRGRSDSKLDWTHNLWIRRRSAQVSAPDFAELVSAAVTQTHEGEMCVVVWPDQSMTARDAYAVMHAVQRLPGVQVHIAQETAQF